MSKPLSETIEPNRDERSDRNNRLVPRSYKSRYDEGFRREFRKLPRLSRILRWSAPHAKLGLANHHRESRGIQTEQQLNCRNSFDLRHVTERSVERSVKPRQQISSRNTAPETAPRVHVFCQSLAEIYANFAGFPRKLDERKN